MIAGGVNELVNTMQGKQYDTCQVPAFFDWSMVYKRFLELSRNIASVHGAFLSTGGLEAGG